MGTVMSQNCTGSRTEAANFCQMVNTQEVPNREELGMRMGRNRRMERSFSDQTSPSGKSGLPRKVDQFFRNLSGWTEPIHTVLD